MIAFFPAPYEDELLYSWLARYYVRTGYMKYVFVGDDLFQTRSELPRIEFINALTEDAIRAVTAYKPLERIILEHTLYPYYARFIPKEKRLRAFNSLMAMDGQHFNLLPVPNARSGADRVLRFCPMCAKEDRAKYGEAYWHRSHQLIGAAVCPKHNCILEDTNISMKSKTSPNLAPAELTIPQELNPTISTNQIDIEVAKYLQSVFLEGFDFDSDVPIEQYFQSRMEGTPYLSIRGDKRFLSKLLSDFNNHYCTLSVPRITEWSQIQKLLQGKRLSPFDICLVANFLKISPYDLTHPILPEVSAVERYDQRILELHEQGLKYPAIMKIVGGSYDYVKSIGEGSRGRYCKGRNGGAKSGPKRVNTKELDISLLPQVRQAAAELWSSEKPVRITTFSIEKRLGLTESKLKALPKCKAEVAKYKETYEQFWYRKVLWALAQIKKEGKPLTYSRVCSITNMSREQFLRASVLFQETELIGLAKSLKE